MIDDTILVINARTFAIDTIFTANNYYNTRGMKQFFFSPKTLKKQRQGTIWY